MILPTLSCWRHISKLSLLSVFFRFCSFVKEGVWKDNVFCFICVFTVGFMNINILETSDLFLYGWTALIPTFRSLRLWWTRARGCNIPCNNHCGLVDGVPNFATSEDWSFIINIKVNDVELRKLQSDDSFYVMLCFLMIQGLSTLTFKQKINRFASQEGPV